MRMRREARRVWLIPVLVAGLGAFSPQTSPLKLASSGNRLEAFREWLDLARHHRPGEADASIQMLRLVPLSRLDELELVLKAFTEFVEEPGLQNLRRSTQFSTLEQRLLAQLAAAEREAKTTNTLLKQLAVLHTDAMVLPGAVFYLTPERRSDRLDVTIVNDGVGLGGARLPPYWQIARQAVEALQPRPAADPWTRQWYEATTAYMFYSAQLGALPVHLAARRLLLSPDATSFFDEGCLSEIFASDRIQATVASEKARGVLLDVPTPRPAHERARWLFTQALAHNRDHAEARLRLGRVHWRLGDPVAAANELTTVLAMKPLDVEVAYLANLFLGAARWTMGAASGAAEAYERAQQLYPTAQSPAVALLLVKPGARESSELPVEALLRRPAVDRDDPFFDYDLGPGRRARALLGDLWKTLPK